MQQARNAAMWMQDEGISARWLLMDRDTKFTRQFRQFWKAMGVEPTRLPVQAPDCNAFCEAFVGRLKAESLNHFVIFSLRHMDYVVSSWVSHYNRASYCITSSCCCLEKSYILRMRFSEPSATMRVRS